MESKVYDDADECLTTDEIAALLVKLYADYKCASENYTDETTEKYAKAVGIAIRMLTD
jgi:hypothetical protein